MEIHIQTYGQGSPLVLFHGWGFDHHIWEPIIPALQTHYCLYLVDLPGFGQSNLMSWEQFKYLLLSQLPISFAVLGWSLGGLYAMRLALEESQRVTHLINVATTPHFIQNFSWPGIEGGVFTDFYERLQSNPKKTIDDFIVLQARKPLLVNNVEGKEKWLGLAAGLDVLQNWDFRQDLRSLSVPCYFMFGRLDAIVPVATYLTMQKEYPQFEHYLFRKAAHMPFLSDQSEFIDIIRSRV